MQCLGPSGLILHISAKNKNNAKDKWESSASKILAGMNKFPSPERKMKQVAWFSAQN